MKILLDNYSSIIAFIAFLASIMTILSGFVTIMAFVRGNKNSESAPPPSLFKRFFRKIASIWFITTGTISLFLVASVFLIVSFVKTLPSSWTNDTIFQKTLIFIAQNLYFRITGEEPKADISPSSDIPKQTIGKSTPFKTSYFSTSLSPATRTNNDTCVKATIVNTMQEPLFIAINDLQWPVLTDDNLGLNPKTYDIAGISRVNIYMNGIEKEEASYNRILPNDRLDIALKFEPYPRGTSQDPGQIHVAMDFIVLRNGKAERVSASPGNIIKSDAN